MQEAVAHLMAADDEVEAIGIQESLGDVGSKLNPAAALARCTALLWLGVTPEDVAHDARVWWLPEAVHLPDIVQRHPILVEQAAMQH